jgi:GTP:adenosylcobinamide-phosphate guanylyltransferase
VRVQSEGPVRVNSGDNWTAIVLAGQRPGENEFAASHKVAAKALIPAGGEPMLGRVVRTLLASPSVGRIVILAQDPAALLRGDLAWMEAEPRIGTAEAGDGISTSILAVAGSEIAPWPVLIVTADHALLTPEIVEDFLSKAPGADAAFAAVERKVVEAAYPQTKRTWIKFSDGHFTGANLFALATPEARKGLAIWSNVEQDRKKSLKLLMFFGPLLALRALTRTISLEGALGIMGRKAGLAIRPVRLPFAEAAIDVDKPADLELVEHILARRAVSEN